MKRFSILLLALVLFSCKFSKLSYEKQKKYIGKVSSHMITLPSEKYESAKIHSNRLMALNNMVQVSAGLAAGTPTGADLINDQIQKSLITLNKDSATMNSYATQANTIALFYSNKIRVVGIGVSIIGLASSALTGFSVGTAFLTYTSASITFADGVSSLAIVPSLTYKHHAADTIYKVYYKNFIKVDSLINNLQILKLTTSTTDAQLFTWIQAANDLHTKIAADIVQWGDPAEMRQRRKRGHIITTAP